MRAVERENDDEESIAESNCDVLFVSPCAKVEKNRDQNGGMLDLTK